MPKKKTPYIQRKQKDAVNKKAIIWIVSVLGAIIIVMTLLLILDQR